MSRVSLLFTYSITRSGGGRLSCALIGGARLSIMAACCIVVRVDDRCVTLYVQDYQVRTLSKLSTELNGHCCTQEPLA